MTSGGSGYELEPTSGDLTHRVYLGIKRDVVHEVVVHVTLKTEHDGEYPLVPSEGILGQLAPRKGRVHG